MALAKLRDRRARFELQQMAHRASCLFRFPG
jgi:hypothetical protein